MTRLSFEIWRSSDARSTLLADVAGFRSLHGLFSWLIGEQIDVLDATAVHPVQTDGDVLSHLFPYPIHFGARASSFAFSSAYLDRQVIRSKHELKELLDFFPFELHSPDASSARLSDQIRAHCRSALLRSVEMPSLESLTRLFRQSSATIRRRLEQEGTSLRLIKQECRLGLASEYLRSTPLTHDEIAQRLGYSSTKPFVHAFKSWSGEAPSAYRRRRRELS
jgi:AraC-like DNA-binding protein